MPSKISADKLLIGAHTSAAGGAHKALLQGREIGATTIQFFTANQRQWTPRPLSAEEIPLFKQTQQELGFEKIMSHAGYLINLGAPDPLMLQKSRQAFALEIERCLSLELSFVNVHPGAAVQGTKEECLDKIVESLLSLAHYFEHKSSLRILLETTAGQGSSVGCRFEELAYIISQVKEHLPIGICVDTCHIFAAGYDLRTAESCEKTLQEFDATIGLKHLYAFHLNDSIKTLGSRVDRHAALGAGAIGIEAFHYLMTSPLTRHLPKYLETPEGPSLWIKEIQMLRDIYITTA